MSCNLTSGIPLGCKSAMGGIKTVYIANCENVTGYTTTGTTVITNIAMAPNTFFYEFDLRREQADNTDVQTTTLQGGISYKDTLNIFLEKNQTSVRNQIMLLGAARTKIIILDKMGQYWLLGKENCCDLVTTTMTTGKAAQDANGYALVFESEEAQPIMEVSSSIIASITSI